MATAAAATSDAVVFVWEGVDRKGTRVKGEAQASNEILLKADLRRQGINPLKVKKKPKPLFGKGKKIVPKDIAIFSRQLATMMAAGDILSFKLLKLLVADMRNLLCKTSLWE